jgi:hypothetical protein
MHLLKLSIFNLEILIVGATLKKHLLPLFAYSKLAQCRRLNFQRFTQVPKCRTNKTPRLTIATPKLRIFTLRLSVKTLCA